MPGSLSEVSGYSARWHGRACWRVLDLVDGSRKVADVARHLGVSDWMIDNWRCQDRIDCGLEPGATSADLSELTAAKQRIRELEIEVAIHRRATEQLKKLADPKRGSPPHPRVASMALARAFGVERSETIKNVVLGECHARVPWAASQRCAALIVGCNEKSVLSRGH